MKAAILACAVSFCASLVAADQVRAQDDELAPLRVYEADPATFVVARQRAKQAGIEGFVVDRDALVERLRTRVLEEQGLGKLAHVAAVQSAPESSWYALSKNAVDREVRLPERDVAYSFNHRFAVPFEELEARLDLGPLGEESTGRLLYPLTFLLALSVVIGLYALYRMVAVQVAFAERRSNFVAAVSHELKTPLTAIRMYGEMLRDDLVESDEKRRSYYATISSETERLSRLINNVLELSRLERDERPVQLVVGDVRSLVAEAVEIVRPHAEREGFRLAVRCADNLPAARFDRDAMMQILFNLLDNAIKYGRGERDRTIEVCCEAARAGVQVSVIDHGKGVEAGHLKAIFEPFYRAQSELTRTQQGTGIGLSLVLGLVRRMGGDVQGLNRHPGFEVRVTLPAAG